MKSNSETSQQNCEHLLSVLNLINQAAPRNKSRKDLLSYRCTAESQDVWKSYYQSRDGIQFYLLLYCRKYSVTGTQIGIQNVNPNHPTRHRDIKIISWSTLYYNKAYNELQRNIESRSHNHPCRGNAMGIKYYERSFLFLHSSLKKE
jgi:hypothetical protein